MTKYDLLVPVAHYEELPAADVADHFDTDLRQACAYLHKAWRAGNLKRWREDGRFAYGLSARGARKLDW